MKIHPFHLPWIRAWDYRYACTEAIDFRRLQTLLINTREPENFSLKLPVWTFVIKESVHDTSWVSASIMCYVGDCRIGNVCTTCCRATYTSGDLNMLSVYTSETRLKNRGQFFSFKKLGINSLLLALVTAQRGQ